MKPRLYLLFTAGFLLSTASLPGLAAFENPRHGVNHLPEIEATSTGIPRAQDECLPAISAGVGFCYDNLAVSVLVVGLPLLSLLVWLRLHREIRAHRRDTAIFESVTDIVERLSREDPPATLLQAIIAAQEAQKTSPYVSLLLAGEKGEACIHETGASRLLAALLHRTDAETGGQDCWSCSNSESPDKFRLCPMWRASPWLLALQSGKPVYVETVNDSRSEMADFLNSARGIGITGVWSQPVQNAQGVILGVVSFHYRADCPRTCHDDANMKRIESLLGLVAGYYHRISQLNLMQALVERNNEPMYLCSPKENFRLCYVNEAAVRHFGYDREKVLNLRVPDYDPNFTLERLHQFWQTLKMQGYHRTNTVNRVAGGHEIPVEVTGFYFEHVGHEYIAGSFRDLSEQRQAEQKAEAATALAETRWAHQRRAESRARLLDDLITHSTTPNYLLDPHEGFRLAYVNPAAVAHFGYPEDQLTKMTIRDLNAEQDEAQLALLWKTLKASGTLGLETWHTRADGSRVEVEITCLYLKHEGREYIAGYCHDITRRKQHESTIIEARQQAEEALAVRNRFMAHMSHELLTPLNGVMGLSRLAQHSDSVVVIRDYLDRIHFSANNLLSLLADILDLARLETGKLQIHQTPISIRTVLHEILNQTRSKAEAKNLNLTVLIDKNAPEWLLGDPHRLGQILLNLIDNAIKFTDQGGIRVLIDKTSHEGDVPVWVRWTVMDSGIGIKPDDLTRLFKPFEQLDHSNQRRYGGGGLGLAICRNLAELMGGWISVSSMPGSGSTFIVELPFQQASPPITPPAQPVKLPSAPLRGLNILIVEDNHINQTIARAVVEKMGATVTVAEDGSQALVLLNSQPPPTYDVILMDIQMPVMDGLTATRHIRSNADFTDLPILAVSAHTLSSDREASLAAGMNAHLAKPLRNEELVRSILQFLPERSLQRLQAATPRLPQSTREGPLNLSILETDPEPAVAHLENQLEYASKNLRRLMRSGAV